nr:hypothetical protein [Paenibacillus polymyxa]
MDYNSRKEAVFETKRFRNYTIAAGRRHTVGLKSDGTTVAVGSNKHHQCDVSGWHEIRAVSAGCAHTIGLKSDGTMVAVGDNDYVQCDVSGWSTIQQ